MINRALVGSILVTFALPEASHAQAADAQEIVRDFRQRLDRVSINIQTDTFVTQFPPDQPGGNANKWYRQWCTLDSLAFDIQQTTSLVSPLVAIVTGSVVPDKMILMTEAEAVAATFEPDTSYRKMMGPTKFKLTYRFEDNRWVLADGTSLIQWVGLFAEIGQAPQWKPLWSAAAGKADNSYCMHFSIWAAL